MPQNRAPRPSAPRNRLSPKRGGQDYPGQDMGRPATGPGAIARMPRRILALLVDWYLCYGLCLLLLGRLDGWLGIAPLLLFLVWQGILVGLTGHTLGHLLCGMQVQGLDGRPVGPRRAFLRALLVCLVVPPIIMDHDDRGAHDRLIDAVLVRIR